jgi:hypothetical protein
LFVCLILLGIIKTILTKSDKDSKIITEASMVLNILLVVFLAMTRETYAIIAAFLLLILKGLLLFHVYTVNYLV